MGSYGTTGNYNLYSTDSPAKYRWNISISRYKNPIAAEPRMQAYIRSRRDPVGAQARSMARSLNSTNSPGPVDDSSRSCKARSRLWVATSSGLPVPERRPPRYLHQPAATTMNAIPPSRVRKRPGTGKTDTTPQRGNNACGITPAQHTTSHTSRHARMPTFSLMDSA